MGFSFGPGHGSLLAPPPPPSQVDWPYGPYGGGNSGHGQLEQGQAPSAQQYTLSSSPPPGSGQYGPPPGFHHQNAYLYPSMFNPGGAPESPAGQATFYSSSMNGNGGLGSIVLSGNSNNMNSSPISMSGHEEPSYKLDFTNMVEDKILAEGGNVNESASGSGSPPEASVTTSPNSIPAPVTKNN